MFFNVFYENLRVIQSVKFV